MQKPKTHSEFQQLDLYWPEQKFDQSPLADLLWDRLPKVELFIRKAQEAGDCVLVYCNDGQNRSLCIVVAYLMRRFNWSFFKSLEFLDAKRPNLQIKRAYFDGLKLFGSEFERERKLTNDWSSSHSFASAALRAEEMVMVNTFRNSRSQLGRQLSDRSTEPTRKRSLRSAKEILKKCAKEEKKDDFISKKRASSKSILSKKEKDKTIDEEEEILPNKAKKRGKSERKVLWRDQLSSALPKREAKSLGRLVGKVKKEKVQDNQVILKTVLGLFPGKRKT